MNRSVELKRSLATFRQMLLGLHWLVVMHGLATLGAFTLAVYVWRLPERPSRKQWIATLTFIGASTGSYGLALLVFDPELRAALELVTLAGVLWTGIAFLGFALAYTGREHHVSSRPYRLLIVLGVVVTGVGLANPAHHLLWRDFTVVPLAGMATARYAIQPLLFAIAAGVYVVVGLGSAALVELATNYTSTTVRRAVIFGLVPFTPLVAGLAWLFDLGPYPQLNLIPLALFPHIAVDVYALYYRDILQLPAGLQRTGHQAVIEDLATPVVTVSVDERVVDLNGAAQTLFDTETRSIHGEPVADLLGTELDLTGEQQVELTVDGEHRVYNLSASPFESEGGSHRGYTVTIQDVTDEIQTKQRMNVLNRILRHNLRNDLNVVRLRTDRLTADGLTDGQRAQIEEIRATIDSLSDLGEKARRASTAMENVTFESVALRAVLESAVAEATRDADAVSVTVDVPPDLTLPSDRDLLTLVFASIVENSVEHGSTSPDHAQTVTITAVRDDGWVRVDVVDNGPGIPEYERRAIEAGDESPLEHSSGLGLWLVQWGATVLGGRVTFDVDDGTTVSVRLPAETPRAAQSTAVSDQV